MCILLSSFGHHWLLYPDDKRIYINITFIVYNHRECCSYWFSSLQMYLTNHNIFSVVWPFCYITRIIVFMHLLHRFIVGYLTVSQHENKICYKQLFQQFYCFSFYLQPCVWKRIFNWHRIALSNNVFKRAWSTQSRFCLSYHSQNITTS